MFGRHDQTFGISTENEVNEMLNKKDSHKIKIVILCLISVFLFSGCQNQKQQNLKSNEEISELTNNNQESMEGKNFLSISVKNNKEAEFTLKSDAFLRSHYARNEAKESNIVYSWKVLFGSFCIDATIYYQDGVVEYSAKDIRCNLSYLEKFEDGGYNTWNIKELKYAVTDDKLKTTVMLPTEEELKNLENIDISSLVSFGFDEVDQFEYSENEQGKELFFFALQPGEIEGDSLEEAESSDGKDGAFSESVYEAGLQKGEMDAVWMAPSTENYLIYDKSKIDPNGVTGLEQKIVLVFDKIGNLIEGYVREGYITGMEAGKNGTVPVLADQETMKLFFQDKLAEGYLEGSDKKLNQGEACMSEQYIYYRLNQTTIDQAHIDSVTQLYLNDLAWVKASPWNAISRMQKIAYTTDQVALVYESDILLDLNAPMVENYCTADDFQYLSYAEMVTDDYFVSETADTCDIYFFDEAGTCIVQYRFMNVTDPATYKGALASGYKKVGGSDTLITMKWENNTAETKQDILLNFKSTLITGEYISYEQSISNNRVAMYFSKPRLNH